ncbi:MAG: hypothetical protein P1V19_02270 [Gimesia sp.]|nr:hypothetical protein [Gimesia sp.]
MKIRSGRFTGKIDKTDPGIEIIKNGHTQEAEPIYRFFNSGLHSFYVEVVDKDNVTQKFTVEKNDSVDVFIKSSTDLNIACAVIKTESQSKVDLEGIYDCFIGSTKVRSGRFNMTVPDAAKAVTLVGNKANQGNVIYRVFNSGKENQTSFKVDTDSPTNNTGVDLKLGNSFDIVVDKNLTIKAAANDDKLKGIYELLGEENRVRPGRFRSKGTHTTELKIIETKKGTNKKKWYRIYNSGREGSVIEVTERKQGSHVIVAEVGSGQTRDLPIGRGAIYVRSADATTPIKGIYEFLGITEK